MGAGAQGIAKTARKASQGTGFIRVRVFDHQIAVATATTEGLEQGRDAVLRIDILQFGQKPQFLARENQVLEGQRARQGRAIGAEVKHKASMALRSRIAGEASQRSAFAQFSGQLRFETGPAIAQQAVGDGKFVVHLSGADASGAAMLSSDCSRFSHLPERHWQPLIASMPQALTRPSRAHRSFTCSGKVGVFLLRHCGW